MQINKIQLYDRNYYNNNSSIQKINTQTKSNNNIQFTGLSDWIARNYYVRFYKSTFAEKFLNSAKGTKAWDNMTTHMSALGSTLISSLYVYRTLTNDKLDEKKRKTLAINDFITWGISTAAMYTIDNKLGDWWGNVTTRFAANYIDVHQKTKRARTIGDWDPANIREVMSNWHQKYNERIDKINAQINSPEYKGLRKPLKRAEETVYKNVRDFNLDVLKNRKLTTLIDGMGVFKSLFIFGMVYRYVVPVLVMKPANMIGRYLHEKNQNKEQAQKA